MKSQPFEAMVRYQPGLAIIDLHGDINAFAESSLNAAISELDSQQPAAIVLNFNDVSYINSTGIALIVSILAQARKFHRRVFVYGLTEHYEEIFKITRLSDFMAIHPDEASALVEAGKTG
jgi:anti-anti-sigma factor